MKPRLEPVDHTPEDHIAWGEVCLRTQPTSSTLYTRSLMQDRRDGDLMLYGQVWRHSTWRTPEWGSYNAMWHGPMFHGELFLGGRWPAGTPLYGRP